MDTVTAKGLARIATKHPEYQGKIADPYTLPRPRGVDLVAWLKAGASEDLKTYCREGIQWTRQHRENALPGFLRLIQAIENP
jgi:hypothetical protein